MINQANFRITRNAAIARIVRAAKGIARPELMIALAIIGAALATPSIAMQGDTIADRVLGQVDFVHNGVNLIDATGMLNPQAVAIDTSVTPNRLYVADTGNSRVLGYEDVATFVNGGAADLVIGQLDFQSGGCNQNNPSPSAGSLCFPLGVAVDGGGNLYVADANNSRVVEYNTPFAGCGSFPCVGGSANLVFGQGGIFTTNSCDAGGVTANTLCFPVGVAADTSNNLYIVDESENRVLEYNTPLTTDTTADLVFGQGNFTDSGCNGGSLDPSASSLCAPDGLAVDSSGDLYVAEFSNNRVVEYTAPLSSSASAAAVFGQGGSFTSGTCDDLGVSAGSLCSPGGIAVDSSGDLYVTDSSNNRVLKYSSPLSSGESAGAVFGQGGSFTSSNCNGGGTLATASSLCNPAGVAVDSSGDLYVAENSNNRVLKYNTPFGSNPSANVVLGQLDFIHDGPNLIDGTGMFNPESVAVDTSVSPNRLYVADTDNSRVLGYKNVNTFVNGGAADLVIGQPDFLSGACNTVGPGASSLCNPIGIAVDATGNLYVADLNNNRVLEYNTPFAACGAFPCVGGGANLVFGQGSSFTSSNCNDGGVGPGSLCSPVGVAVDGGGNIYIADFNNNRVLEYNTPLTTDTVADEVFGQANSFTSFSCNNGGLSAGSLCLPIGVAVDSSGHLYIADNENSRVLEYNSPLTSDTTADLVLGQPDFVSSTCDNGGVSASSLCAPFAISADSRGDLYVADLGNSRVLEYNSPLASDMSANDVFGQGNNFSTDTCNFDGLNGTADNLCDPTGVAVDVTGNLYIADTENNRTLEYDQPLLGLPTPTASATATATATVSATATATAQATNSATATATQHCDRRNGYINSNGDCDRYRD